MDTLTKSCSPTTFITANGEVQTHEEATSCYVEELYIFLTLKVLEDTPAVVSLGKLCDEHGYSYEWINGQKPHLITNGIRIQCNTENYVPIVVPGLSTSSSSSFPSWTSMTPSRQETDHPTSSSNSSTSPTVTVSSDSETRAREDLCGTDSDPASVSSSHVERKERGDPLTKSTKNPKPNKNEDHDRERGDLFNSDIPEWLQEFRESLVDDRVPERRDSHASSSHEPSLEPTPTRSVDLGKHSVYTHFPKDRNCEICQRTKITRAPCRRRIGGAVLREENFGDLITADHKVLSEGCESWNNHRYAIVVQGLATQWIQSYPCKTKTSLETQRSLQKILEPNRNPQVIYTDNSLEFGKACEDLSWNYCTSTPHRSETNGLAERAVRRVKEGTSAVLLQSRLDENWWADSMECYTSLRNVQDSLVWCEDSIWETFWWNHLKDRSFRLVHWSSITLFLRRTSQESINLERKSYWIVPQIRFVRGGTLEGWNIGCRMKSTQKDSMQKRWYFPKKIENSLFQSQMDESNFLEEIRNWEHPPWYGNVQFEEKVSLIFLESQKGLFHNLTTHFRMPVKW